MNAESLYEGLQDTGYPVAYWAFKSEQAPPFVVYRFIESADFLADNANYHGAGDYHVELYTKNKDPAAESAVEDVLRALGLPWVKAEASIEAEKMFQILYQVRLIEGVNDGEQS